MRQIDLTLDAIGVTQPDTIRLTRLDFHRARLDFHMAHYNLTRRPARLWPSTGVLGAPLPNTAHKPTHPHQNTRKHKQLKNTHNFMNNQVMS